MNFDRLYLDYNATSPLSKSVTNWLKSGDLLFGNPSSQHSDGKAARKSINETRSLIFETFNKKEKETKLFFHSGATESFHTFASSFAETCRLNGKDLLICYSKVDHPAVTALSEKYLGPHVKFHELLRDKKLHYKHQENFEVLKDKKENNPELVILYHHLWVHNETGQVSSLKDIEIFKQIPDLYIHVDAVQAPGKIPDWKNLSTGDIWTFSPHKFGALKGIGFSLFSSTVEFHPLIKGGGQQSNLRSGTENVLGVKSIALALKDLEATDVQNTKKLRDELLREMKKSLNGFGEVIDDDSMASNTIYFYLHKSASDIALALFDLNGLEISAGSACSSGAAKESAVLLQMGLGPYAKNGLRLSLPLDIHSELLNKISDRLRPVFAKLQHN